MRPPLEVFITEAPGEKPTYVLPGGARIYGLGPPPPPRFRQPKPAQLASLLNQLLPATYAVEVAERWGRDGLFIRIVHLETSARGWAVMRRPTDLHHDLVSATMDALDTALDRLRAANSGNAPLLS